MFAKHRDIIYNLEKKFVFDLQLDLDQIEKQVEHDSRIEFLTNQEEETDEEYQVFDLDHPDHSMDIEIKEKSNNTNSGTFLCPTLLTEDSYFLLIRSLNEKQMDFLYGLINYVKTVNKPFYYFLTGGAGTGKSVLIKSVFQTLTRWYNRGGGNPDQVKVLLLGPTGKSAFNIRGTTIHSALRIYNQNGQLKKLSPDIKNTMRSQLWNLKAIIIDEVSMVGATMLGKINQRLQEIFGCNTIFGGISILFVGDFNQLPPVGDNFAFQANERFNYSILAGSILWQSTVKYYELTEIMRQKEDQLFAHALNRLSIGIHTEEDEKMFRSRLFAKDSPDLPIGATRLFQLNKQVDSYNQKILDQTNGELVISEAMDFPSPGLSKQVRESALYAISFLQCKDTYNLPKYLSLKVGIRYVISTNVDIVDGLVNGTSGFLRAIDFIGDQVSVLWFDFSEPDIGLKARSMFSSRELNGHLLTPVERVIRDIQTKTEGKIVLISRKQFPCLVSEAITIHKAQGQTYDQVVIDVSRKMNLSTFYTSLSRAQSLDGLYLMGEDIIFPSKRPECHPVSEEITRLKNEASLEFDLKFPRSVKSDGNITIFYQNFPYLSKHSEDLSYDFNVNSCDLLALVETRSRSVLIRGFELDHELFPNGSRPFGISLYRKIGSQMGSTSTNNIIIADDSHIERMRLDFGLFVLFVFYISPTFPKMRALIEIEKDLSTSMNRNVIAVGDWNTEWNSDYGNKLNELMRSMNFNRCPQNRSPSTDRGSSIDYLFSTMDIENCFYYESIYSDHKPLIFSVKK